ncbi:Oxidoreductase htatip2 [Gaertneriomyces sp. JEL0708]|nr:Oxidoreductase htatip2 [Gaertneriomyces sp. JEL0708]
MEQKHACIILGATGAVGSCLLRELLTNPNVTKVTSLGRRTFEYTGPNAEALVQKVVNFEDLKAEDFKDHDIFACALGTTRAQAGSAEAFQKIDRDYVLNAARAFKEANPTTPVQCLYVSSMNANPSSWFLYPKTKGEIEEGLKKMNFASCAIFRPAFLVTEHHRPEKRFGEDLVAPLMAGRFGKWANLSVPVGTVAHAMSKWLSQPSEKQGNHIFDNKQILTMGATSSEQAHI